MSLHDKMRCQRCSHTRGAHPEGPCTKDLGRQITCSCKGFKVVQPGSPDFKLLTEAARG